MSARNFYGGPAYVVSPPVARRAEPTARVAEVLRQVRVAAGETQVQHAARLRVHPTVIALAETGRMDRVAAITHVDNVLTRCGHGMQRWQYTTLTAYVAGAEHAVRARPTTAEIVDAFADAAREELERGK